MEGLKNAGALLSVDTRNASTMRVALKAGAGLINDISALTHDADSINVVSDSDCRVCLMHMQGTPQTMQADPHYHDVVNEVHDYLRQRIEVCLDAGIAKDRLMIDVGIGFGKTLTHNMALLRSMSKFHDLGVDILLGVSRKSFIEKICGRSIPAADRGAGSLAAMAAAGWDNLQIVRVHDVAATRQFLDVIQKICV
ncbi:MAG TPA: dihydropteroate synthase [Rhodospirillaceae bacterium]|nr:dihydropteroate synthase [Rhodospirillaceae bacterium]